MQINSEGASLAEVSQQLVFDAAIGVGTSLLAGGIFRYAPSIIRIRPNFLSGPFGGRPSNSLWNIKGILRRGEAVEKALIGQRRLPWSYPTIDDFTDNVATSVKSLDLLSSSAANTSYIRRQIVDAAQNLNKFVPRNYGKARLAGEAIKGKVLVFAFEKGAANKSQAKALVNIANEIATSFRGEIKLVYKWLQ